MFLSLNQEQKGWTCKKRCAMHFALIDRNGKRYCFAHLYTKLIVGRNKLRIQVPGILNFSEWKKKSFFVIIKVQGIFFHYEKSLKLKLSYCVIKAKLPPFPGDCWVLPIRISIRLAVTTFFHFLFGHACRYWDDKSHLCGLPPFSYSFALILS